MSDLGRVGEDLRAPDLHERRRQTLHHHQLVRRRARAAGETRGEIL